MSPKLKHNDSVSIIISMCYRISETWKSERDYWRCQPYVHILWAFTVNSSKIFTIQIFSPLTPKISLHNSLVLL